MRTPKVHSGNLAPNDPFTGHLGKLLSTLSQDVRKDLLKHAQFRDVEPGDIIIETGELSVEIGYVIDGTLAMTQVIEDGRKHIIGLLVPTDLYGRLFDGPSTYRIEALARTRLCYFDRAHFEHVLRQQPEAERLFVVHILDELDAAREWLLLISGRKVLHRVASFLAILLRRTRPSAPFQPTQVHLPLARKDLAQYLGTRPESLSRAFHELEHNRILRIIDPYHFEILDIEALVEISGHDLDMVSAQNARP